MPRVHGYRDAAGRPRARLLVRLPRFRAETAVSFLLDTGSDGTAIHLDDRLLFDVEAVHTGEGLTLAADVLGIGGVAHSYAIEEAEYVFEDEDGAAWPLPGHVHIALDPAVDGIPSLLGRDILDKVLFCISEHEITLDW